MCTGGGGDKMDPEQVQELTELGLDGAKAVQAPASLQQQHTAASMCVLMASTSKNCAVRSSPHAELFAVTPGAPPQNPPQRSGGG
jgi:hypothetical protein